MLWLKKETTVQECDATVLQERTNAGLKKEKTVTRVRPRKNDGAGCNDVKCLTECLVQKSNSQKNILYTQLF